MDNFFKKHKKKAGRCPLCQKELKIPKQELLNLLDFNDDLGIVTKQMVKDRYKELSKVHHPDRPTGSPEKFQQISKAKEELLELLEEEEALNINHIEEIVNQQDGAIKSNIQSEDNLNTNINTTYSQFSSKNTERPKQYNYDQYQQIKQTILNMKKQLKPGSPCPYCKKKI